MVETDNNMPNKRQQLEDLRSKARWKTKQIDKLHTTFQNRAIKPTMIKNSTNKLLTGQLFLGSEINLRCMLSAYHLGTGPLDIMKNLSMIGCDINHNFMRTVYRKSKEINQRIIDTCNSIIELQMVREVEATIKHNEAACNKLLTSKNDLEKCKTATSLQTLHIENSTRLTCSYDMGWQKRAGGRIYDSISGHGFMIGCFTRKVVGWGVMRKKCKICEVMTQKYDDIHPHECLINYEGSSGAMESKLAVRMIHDTWNKSGKKVTIGTIVADDDSTLKANTKNKNNRGLLDDDIETPKFLADPSHRIKCIIRSVYKLVKKTKIQIQLKQLMR